MNEFTLEEINFLRWLFEKKFNMFKDDDKIAALRCRIIELTDYQSDLLLSIQSKLKEFSST